MLRYDAGRAPSRDAHARTPLEPLLSTAVPFREPSQPPAFPTLDAAAFDQDLSALRAELGASFEPEELTHFHKLERWGRACTLLGYATAWLVPNPVSALLLAQGSTTRWTMVAHHVTHRGYDRVRDVPARYTGRGFAVGWRRFVDWLDWIAPDAWRHEHNVLHHGRTGERVADPDLVEDTTGWLRDSRMPRWAKYLLVALIASTWKLTYYAPNTFQEWRRSERRRAGGGKEGDSRLVEAFNPLTAEGRAFWATCVLPYVAVRFVLLPLLFLPLGTWAALSVFINSVLAEVITNLQTFVLIAPNHAGDDLYRFDDRASGRAEYYVRQVVGATNYRTGGDVVDFLHGGLNYQIEHHLWPDLTLRQYQWLQPRVKSLCEKHGVPYVQEGVFRRVGKLLHIMVGKTSMRRLSSRQVSAD
ncbi:fatty acid desaturase family protein [Pyxidicoccus sp. 3LFB2]